MGPFVPTVVSFLTVDPLLFISLFQFLCPFLAISFSSVSFACFLTSLWSPYSVARFLQPWRSCMLLQSSFLGVVQC